MPIISSTQKEREKEEEIERQRDRELLKSVDEKISNTKKESVVLSEKRKRNAKRFAFLWFACFVASSAIFFTVSRDAGLILAVGTTVIPSLVNLVDD